MNIGILSTLPHCQTRGLFCSPVCCFSASAAYNTMMMFCFSFLFFSFLFHNKMLFCSTRMDDHCSIRLIIIFIGLTFLLNIVSPISTSVGAFHCTLAVNSLVSIFVFTFLWLSINQFLEMKTEYFMRQRTLFEFSANIDQVQ